MLPSGMERATLIKMLIESTLVCLGKTQGDVQSDYLLGAPTLGSCLIRALGRPCKICCKSFFLNNEMPICVWAIELEDKTVISMMGVHHWDGLLEDIGRRESLLKGVDFDPSRFKWKQLLSYDMKDYGQKVNSAEDILMHDQIIADLSARILALATPGLPKEAGIKRPRI